MDALRSRGARLHALAAGRHAVRTGVEIPSNHELRTVCYAIALIAGAGSLIGVLNR